MSNLADRIYAVRLSIGQAAMEIENVDGADAGVIFDSMTDLDEIESELRALLAERDALRERQHKLEIHETDCPVFRDFFHKHAIGEMINPSCLVCGKETKRSEAAITHSELVDIVVCMRCRDAAQSILNHTLSEGERV